MEFRSANYFLFVAGRLNVLNIKTNPATNVKVALEKIEQVSIHCNPGQPFAYRFADEEYGRKSLLSG